MEDQSLKVYHGGARQLPVRWPNTPQDKPHRFSFYEVMPGEICSRHVHTGKCETWIIVAGSGVVSIDDQDFPVSRGDALATSPGSSHKLVNTGSEPLLFVNLVTFTGGAVSTTELSDP